MSSFQLAQGDGNKLKHPQCSSPVKLPHVRLVMVTLEKMPCLSKPCVKKSTYLLQMYPNIQRSFMGLRGTPVRRIVYFTDVCNCINRMLLVQLEISPCSVMFEIT